MQAGIIAASDQPDTGRDDNGVLHLLGGSPEDNTHWLPVAGLLPGESPRLNGVDEDHARTLAECEQPLPPIIVHRASGRVIDGMHRLYVARQRGDELIEARFFDGDEAEAFVFAVKANKAHGLPLTLADREAAAARILDVHPNYSDRRVASITGLSAKTVGAVRRRTVPSERQGAARIGRDGRVRPVSSAEGRRIAVDVLAARPQASLREVARVAGISMATVRDVRERIRRGESPIPPRQRRGEPDPGAVPAVERASMPVPFADRVSLLRTLNNDPALRFTDSGRMLLRWLHSRASGLEDWPDRLATMPPHCAYVLARLARACAAEWHEVAASLEHQLGSTG